MGSNDTIRPRIAQFAHAPAKVAAIGADVQNQADLLRRQQPGQPRPRILTVIANEIISHRVGGAAGPQLSGFFRRSPWSLSMPVDDGRAVAASGAPYFAPATMQAAQLFVVGKSFVIQFRKVRRSQPIGAQRIVQFRRKIIAHGMILFDLLDSVAALPLDQHLVMHIDDIPIGLEGRLRDAQNLQLLVLQPLDPDDGRIGQDAGDHTRSRK